MAQVLASGFVAGKAPLSCFQPLPVPRHAHSRRVQCARPVARLGAEERNEQPRLPPALPRAAAALSVALPASLVAAGSAQAIESTDIVDALEKAEVFAQKTGEVLVKTYDVTKSVLETVVRVAKPAVEAAAPVVRDAAQSALQAAAPVVADGASKAAKFLEEQGLDLQPVVQASKVASEVTSSLVEQSSAVSGTVSKALLAVSPLVAFVQSQSPPFLAAEAGALLLLWLSFPALLGSLVYSLRGYGGDLTPAQTLDRLLGGDYTLVDVRTEAEKEQSGVPSMPRNARRKLLFIPIEEIEESLIGKLKNSRALECELTAIKIAAHKKLGRGSKVIILDSTGGLARRVARSLSSLGFRDAYAVQDGVDGSQGWANAELPLDFYESKAELLTPGALISGAFGRPSTGDGDEDGTTKVKARGTAQLKAPESRPGLLLPSGRGGEDNE